MVLALRANHYRRTTGSDFTMFFDGVSKDATCGNRPISCHEKPYVGKS